MRAPKASRSLAEKRNPPSFSAWASSPALREPYSTMLSIFRHSSGFTSCASANVHLLLRLCVRTLATLHGKRQRPLDGVQEHGCRSSHIPASSGTAMSSSDTVSYTHLRAHETRHDLVCRLLLEKKKQ